MRREWALQIVESGKSLGLRMELEEEFINNKTVGNDVPAVVYECIQDLLQATALLSWNIEEDKEVSSYLAALQAANFDTHGVKKYMY